MRLLRIVNAFYAALFLVMALVSIAFLSASLHDRAPENVWVIVGWAALFLLYAGLAFVNMRRAGGEGVRDRLLALNLAAATPMIAFTFAADPGARFLCGVAAVPFALTAAMLLIRRNRNAV